MPLGLFGKGDGASLFTSEGRSEHVVPNVVQTTQFIGRIAITFIALSTISVGCISMTIGIEPARAFLQSFWVSISAFMTAGFVPMSQNIMYYHSVSIEVILIVVMLLGSINFTLHAEVLRGRVKAVFEDTEVKFLVAWIVLIVIVLASSLSGSRLFSDLPNIERRGLFMVFAALTTTGFQNVTTSQLAAGGFSSGAFLVLAILMAMGASSGSTAGGVKTTTIAVLLLHAFAGIRNEPSPGAFGRSLEPDTLKKASSVFFVNLLLALAGSLAICMMQELNLEDVLFECFSAIGTVGMTTGITRALTPAASYIVAFLMFCGRVGSISFAVALFEKRSRPPVQRVREQITIG